MTFDTFQKQHLSYIEKELNIFLGEFSQRFNTQPRLKSFISSFIKANKNGKRIRELLMLLGYELSGKKITKEIIQLAALYEIIQTGLLIHDDIIDRSRTRRGEKSVYAEFGEDHYAISQGISLGDLGYFFSESILSEIDFSNEIRNALYKELNFILSHTAIGQLLDVSFSKPPRPTQDEVISMMYHKTAVYTFIGPLRLGIIASGNTPSDTVEQFGRNLGIGFQIQDDLLGIFGDEGVIGKSTLTDIQEGKYTLLYQYALRNADGKSAQWLQNMYGSSSLSSDDILRIKDIFEKTGAKQFVMDMIQKHFVSAQEYAAKLDLDTQKEQLIVSLIQFLSSRKK